MSEPCRSISRGFMPGDVVYLKGGGPMMTVTGITTFGEVSCIWFNAVDELQMGSFSPLVLEEAEPS